MVQPTIEFKRRVVTGVDENGKSKIWLDGEVPKAAVIGSSKEGRVARVIWAVDEVPAPLELGDPMVNWFPAHEWFTKTGVHFGVFTWQPGASYSMHASDTIDVLVVLSGAIELILERGSTVLRAGDCLVQRATMHGWRVYGEEPCIFAGVLIAEKKD